MAPNTTVVHVRPMARFGFSGAKLCIAHFDEARVGRPFVVKVDDVDDFELERAATADLMTFFDDADVHSCAHGAYGAIAYPLRETSKGEIETFEDALRSPGETRRGLETPCSACLSDAAARLTRRHVGASKAGGGVPQISPQRSHGSGSGRSAGRHLHYGPFDFYGETIIDPRAVKAQLDATEVEMTVGPIHGDLHGSNVVFDRDDHPHLIDFAWGDRSDS